MKNQVVKLPGFFVYNGRPKSLLKWGRVKVESSGEVVEKCGKKA